MARKKGDFVTLRCGRCSWSSELAMSATEVSQVLGCAHCGAAIYWHKCPTCGLGYVGEETPRCAVCDGYDEALDFD